MTEQEKKLGDKFAAYSILPKAEQRGFLIAYRLLEDEIDELTKEVERLRKGIDWTRAEYIKCVNDNDEITEKLEELLTTH